MFPLVVTLDTPVHVGEASKSPIAPEQQIELFATLPNALPQLVIDTIKRGEAAIFVWGEICYLDAFNKQRSTKFRMYSTGSDFDRGELAYHHDGNTAE